jgi:hypothetical protein
MTLYCIIFKIDSLEFVLARFFPFYYYSSIQPSVRSATTGLVPNSTQKTSLMGEDCPHLYVALPHHQFPMWD